jgi:hypothetical protein
MYRELSLRDTIIFFPVLLAAPILCPWRRRRQRQRPPLMCHACWATGAAASASASASCTRLASLPLTHTPHSLLPLSASFPTPPSLSLSLLIPLYRGGEEERASGTRPALLSPGPRLSSFVPAHTRQAAMTRKLVPECAFALLRLRQGIFTWVGLEQLCSTTYSPGITTSKINKGINIRWFTPPLKLYFRGLKFSGWPTVARLADCLISGCDVRIHCSLVDMCLALMPAPLWQFSFPLLI